jgi:CubicO group peptidase (beta-lactamase class C family)
LAPFRATYAYSNFGLTAGGIAAVNAANKKDWSAFTRDLIFKPLGMLASTYSRAPLAKMKNVASLHQKVNGRWVLGPERNADAQAPAGSANSTVMDLARWMRMILAEGTFEGKRIVAEAPLKQMLSIQANTAKDSEGRVTGYGFGMEVAIDAGGSVSWSHSGAFQNGASTQVYLVPELELGIVTLTNGWLIGVPEAINATFDDWVRYGKSTQDWLQVIGGILAPYTTPTFLIDGQEKPNSPKPAGVLAGYAGRYTSDYAGKAKVALEGRQLVLALGPQGQTRIPLRHWDGDTFFYNGLNLPEGFYTAVRFSRDSQGNVASFKVDEVNSDLGIFSRQN